VASEIGRNGGTVRRVVLDYELKEELYRALNKLGPAESPDQERERIASRHGLKVVDGTIPIPDLRIEYETEARQIEYIDLEFATREYRSRGMAQGSRWFSYVRAAPSPEGVRISPKTRDGGVYFHSGERPGGTFGAASEQFGENSLEKCVEGTFRRRFHRERHRAGAVNKREKNQMEERERKNRTLPKHAERRERPHRSAKARPGPCGRRGALPPLAARNRSTCFGRGKSLRQTDCMQQGTIWRITSFAV
jgi:hypothetical protein